MPTPVSVPVDLGHQGEIYVGYRAEDSAPSERRKILSLPEAFSAKAAAFLQMAADIRWRKGSTPASEHAESAGVDGSRPDMILT